MIKLLRKPYLSMILAVLVLYASCNQYDPVAETRHTFDSAVFNTFKNSKHFDNVVKNLEGVAIQSRQGSVLEKNKEILTAVNAELGTNLVFPDEILELSLEMNADQIYNTALDEGWMTQEDINLTKDFANDIQTNGFDVAIVNFQSKVLSLNLSDEELARKNAFVNIMKSIDYENPEFFQSHDERSWWRCVLALIAFVAALVGLPFCAAILPCLLAYTLFINASLAVADHC